MVVAAIDKGNFNRSVLELQSGGEPAKATAENNHLMPIRHSAGTSNYSMFLRCKRVQVWTAPAEFALFFAGERIADYPIRGVSLNFIIHNKLARVFEVEDKTFGDGWIRFCAFAFPNQLIACQTSGSEFANTSKIVVNESYEVFGRRIETPQFQSVEAVGRHVVVTYGEPSSLQIGRKNNLRSNVFTALRKYSFARPFPFERGKRFNLFLQFRGGINSRLLRICHRFGIALERQCD